MGKFAVGHVKCRRLPIFSHVSLGSPSNSKIQLLTQRENDFYLNFSRVFVDGKIIDSEKFVTRNMEYIRLPRFPSIILRTQIHFFPYLF